jgi:ribosome biogenesis GTPase A
VGVPPEVVQLVNSNTVFLLNKIDLVPNSQAANYNVALARVVGQARPWRVSAVTGDGMKGFLAGFGEILRGR